MALIFTVHLLLLIGHFIEIARDSFLKTAFLHVPLVFILYTVYVIGRALHLMHGFGIMHA
jgi:exosortase/archaeosortase